MSVPPPDLPRPPLPEMLPRKLVVMLWLTVSDPLPSVIAPPVPERDATVWPPFSRSKIPPFTVSAPVGARLPPGPSTSEPMLTDVPPV